MDHPERVSIGGCDLNISSNSKTAGHQMKLVRARFEGKKVNYMVVLVQADLSSKEDWMSSGKFVENF